MHRRLRVELALLACCALLTVGTLLWPDWLELAFGVDPDGGGGAVEWSLLAGSLTGTAALLAVTAREWRRSADA